MNKTTLFEDFFNNAVINSIAILAIDGTILEINNGFTNNFGYTNEDLKGKNFEELFTSHDRHENKPALELEIAITNGQANDDGFILHKDGNPVWCSGEIMLAYDANRNPVLIKDIINLQARKQLNFFLKNTEELLDRIFHASRDIPMMILDGGLKVIDINKAFLRFFNINKTPAKGISLSTLNHPFWNNPEVKNDLRQVAVTNSVLAAQPYSYESESGAIQRFTLATKIIYAHPGGAKRIFLIVEDISKKMFIDFDHLGQKFVAEFFYNDNETKESVTMKFENDFNADIVFYQVNGVWTSISDMKSHYPRTYVNIQTALLYYIK